MCKQLNQWPLHIIEAVAPLTLPSPDMQKQLALLPDPLEQLDSSATNLGDNLAKACVNCWSNGLEDYSHLLDEC